MSRIRTNLITNRMANGAPTVSNGLVISGVTTVTTLDLNGDLDVDGHLNADNVSIAGVCTATSFVGSGANLTGITIPGGGTNLDLLDSSGTGNGRIRLGASQDLQIYHDGSHSWFKNTTGRLLLQTDGDQIQLRGNTIVAFNGAASTEYLRIDTSGRTLIGTSTQNNSARLQVSTSNQVVATFEGTGSSDPQIYLGDNMASPTDNCIILGYDKADNRGYLTVGGDGDSVFTVTNGGNIGINQSSPQANAKLHVEGNVGSSGYFYTTTTSSPQTDFTSSIASNKAGLLLHRSSETNGDYGGIEFHNHPSSITTYRKGGIYFQSDGSGFGRGDMVFANDMAADANNLSVSDEKLRIHREGYLTSPHQVGFYATANSGGTISMTDTHTLTNWRLSTSGKTYSIGGHFNTSNGRFTAPVAGQYLFTASILLAGYDQASGIHMIWRKNGTNYQYWYNTRTSNIDRSGYGGYLAQGSTTTFSMVANDYIDIACTFGGSLSLWAGDQNWGHFSGYLLG